MDNLAARLEEAEDKIYTLTSELSQLQHEVNLLTRKLDDIDNRPYSVER